MFDVAINRIKDIASAEYTSASALDLIPIITGINEIILQPLLPEPTPYILPLRTEARIDNALALDFYRFPRPSLTDPNQTVELCSYSRATNAEIMLVILTYLGIKSMKV